MLEFNDWVTFTGIAPKEYQGVIGRIALVNNSTTIRKHGKLGYYVTINTYKGFNTTGYSANWITPCAPPEGETLHPWLLREMKR